MQKLRGITLIRQAIDRWTALSLARNRQHHHHPQPKSPARPPPGCMAVYVGAERRRFVIPTRYINFPVFAALLERTEEMFGYQAEGGLVLQCDPDFLGNVLRLLRSDEERYHSLGLDGFEEAIRKLALDAADGGCGGAGGPDMACRDVEASEFTPFSPLLQKVRG